MILVKSGADRRPRKNIDSEAPRMISYLFEREFEGALFYRPGYWAIRNRDFPEILKIGTTCQDLFLIFENSYKNFQNSYKNFMDRKFLYTRIRIFQPPKLKILIKAYKKKKVCILDHQKK